MALTYLNASMIEQPAVIAQLSASELQVGFITNDTNILGNVTIFGQLTALSGFNVVISSTTSTSALSVSNISPVPALEVYQGPANSTIAIFKNNFGDIVLIKDTGITINGSVSSNNLVYDVNGHSGNWNAAHTTTNSNSANWNAAYTTTNAYSGNWNAAYTTTNPNSANWDLGYASYTTTNPNSGNWNAAYTTTNAYSGNWNAPYTTTNSNSADWDLGYTGYTTTNSNSANWDAAYTTTNTYSANWVSASATAVDTAQSYIHTNFLPLSGGTITNRLTVTETISTSKSIQAANLWPNTYRKTTFFILTSNGSTAATAAGVGAVIFPIASGGQITLQPGVIYNTEITTQLRSVAGSTVTYTLSGNGTFTLINGYAVSTSIQTATPAPYYAANIRDNIDTTVLRHTLTDINSNPVLTMNYRLSSNQTVTLLVSAESSASTSPFCTPSAGSRWNHNPIAIV